MRRVSVDPAYQQHGVASVMVGFAEELAGDDGLDGLWLTARVELPETVEFWQRRGYFVVARRDPFLELGKALPVVVGTERPEDTVALGQRLAALLAPGDLLVLAGGLGAGKTTLARGIGAGLGVRGDVTSPTFVIARVHPPTGTGPALVHADAYRLGGVAELDDLDLDASLASSVTVVEWGSGVAEGMSASWLEVRLDRRLGAGDLDDTAHTDAADGTDHPVVADGTDQASGAERLDPRTVTVVPHGSRWSGVPLRSALLTGPA